MRRTDHESLHSSSIGEARRSREVDGINGISAPPQWLRSRLKQLWSHLPFI